MAASVTKSSPSRNPNSRSSEINNPMRRSFSGNPFAKPSIVTKQKGFNPVTPANSPSDFPRRHSINRENIHPSREDKENGSEHELKPPARARSPSVFKGTKNFMSPTISAASKVTASPKKKILAEKNESLYTSFSSSGGKASVNSVSFSDVLEFIDAEPQTHSNHDSGIDEFEHKVADFRAPLTPKASSGFDVKVHSTPKNDSRLRPGATHAVEEDCVNLDWSSIGSSPCPSRAFLAPLDADPSMHAYDPETNFTSPRPQFLRYRPNPRIEVYLNREREGKGLEDSFISGSSSDAELTEETETQSEGSQKDSDDVSSSEMLKEEVSGEMEQDDEASVETVQGKEYSGEVVQAEEVLGEVAKEISGETEKAEVLGEVVKEEEEVLHVSESKLPISSSACMVEVKKVSKLHFFRRPKTVALLLTLLIACLSVAVTDSPVVGLVLKDSSCSNFYVPPEFSAYVTAHLDGLAQNFRLWYAKSISYLSELASNLRVSRFGTLKYSNLTALYDDQYLVDGYIFFNQHDTATKKGLQDYVLESEPLMGWERVVETEPLQKMDENHGYGGLDSEVYEGQEYEKVEVEVEVDIPAADEVHSDLLLAGVDGPEYQVREYSVQVAADSTPEAEAYEGQEHENVEVEVDDIPAAEHSTPEAEVSEANNLDADMAQENMDFWEHSEVADTTPELSKAGDLQGENDLHPSAAEINAIEAEESPERPELLDASSGGRQTVDFNWFRDEVSKSNVLGIAFLFLALLAATTLYVYKRKENTAVSSINMPAPTSSIPVDQPLLTKKFDISSKSVSVSVEHSFHERLSSPNWPTEVDMVGESCPSEMSSFQKSSSYSKKGVKDSSEAQSQDRKAKKSYKRESLASSDDNSVGSLSYGSFTSYAKISAKRANGEEITPVRRSSRIIRKQVTSP